MRILLSPSTWIFLNPACKATLIPFRMVVPSATKIDAAPRLNADALMNLPSQLRIMKPPTTPWDVLDPLKLILINPLGGFLHATQWLFLWLLVEKLRFGGWSDCVSLCLMRHSALAFFALKSVITGFEFSFQKNCIISCFPDAPQRGIF